MAPLVRGSKGPYPYLEGQHLIMAAREFIFTDESGTHGRAEYCVVAGYRGSPVGWGTFDREWNAVLSRNHVVDAFHADPFWNRSRWTRKEPNQFKDWTEVQAKRLISGLVKVISGHRIYSIGGGVPVAAFNALEYCDQCSLTSYVPPHLLGDSARVRIKNPEPYMLAYRMAIYATIEDVAVTTRLHFRIAKHQQYGPRAEEYWRTLKEALADGQMPQAGMLQDITQREPADEPAIQAADLLAYLWYRSTQVGGDANLTADERDTFRAIRGVRNHLSSVDANQLEQWLNADGAETRALWQTIKRPSRASR